MLGESLCIRLEDFSKQALPILRWCKPSILFKNLRKILLIRKTNYICNLAYFKVLIFKAQKDYKNLQIFINSVIVNVVSVLLVVLFSLMMGYAFVRMEWKWSNKVLTYVLLGLMIPIHATLLPNFVIFRQLKMLDAYFALIIPYVAFSLPQAVFLMTGFIRSIPRDLEESAIIDGCSIFRILFQIILPLPKPALVAITVTTFLTLLLQFISIFYKMEMNCG